MQTNQFWERVLEALRDRGVTSGQQTYVAGLIHIKQPSVAEWVTGSLPSMKNCTKLATKLGVNTDWLYTGRGEKRPGRPSDDVADELWQLWPRLDESARRQILGYAQVMEKAPKPVAVARAKAKKTA